MNKKFLVTAILLPLLLLAGCQSTSKPSENDSSHNSVKTSESSKASESSKLQASKNETQANFSVPSKDKKSEQYVKSGKLTKINQFSYDSLGTKLTLKNSKTSHLITQNKQIKYELTNHKIYQNKATTSRAVDAAETAFSTVKIGSSYTTLQLKFTVTNYLNKPILIDGVSRIKFNNAGTVSSASGLSDSSAGQQIKANSSKSFFAMALLPNDRLKKLNPVSISFSGGYNSTGSQIAKTPATLQLQLE